MSKLYVLGPITGNSSYPLALQGFLRAFRAHGLDPIEVDLSGPGGELAYKLSLGVPPEKRESNLVFAMKPGALMSRLVTDHGMTLVGKHAGDVDAIPEEWREVMACERLVVVPSWWMANVVRQSGVLADRPDDLLVSSPGIPEQYFSAGPSPVVLPDPEDQLHLLHCCSAAAFPERKGTPQALGAFDHLVRAGRELRLTLLVLELRRPLRKLLDGLSEAARKRIVVRIEPFGLPVEAMIGLYRQHHALLAPSRAEGFGCQALEMRALGLPVVQTLCTGHADHLSEGAVPEDHGVVPVEHGPLALAWGDFGRAPEVMAEAVTSALERLVGDYQRFEQAAQAHASEMKSWSWVETTRELAGRLADLVEGGEA